VLALAGVGALMFFIHHIASSIEASNIIASVAQETIAAIDRLFPEKLGQGPDENEDPRAQCPLAERNWIAAPAKKGGYIQSVNNAAILRLAQDNKTIVRMEHGIGEFVVQGTKLASLAPEDSPDEPTIDALQSAFSISNHRTVEQDAAFGIRQIVDVALKALSPGINDTTTAVMCVDHLTSILARVTPRQIPSSYRFEDGELRAITKGPSFESLLTESFDQIRRSANGDVVILSRILDALQIVASVTACPSRLRMLREQVQRIAELVEHTIEAAHDRAAIDRHLTRVFETVDAKGD
jgi:uncharacterized membrane protein